jgi:hypothetical protein
MIFLVVCFQLFCTAGFAVVATTSSAALDEATLRHHIHELRGDDYRLFRWDASDHTVSRQNPLSETNAEGGRCNDLSKALQLIASYSGSEVENDDGSNSNNDPKLLYGLACEYATFCITDHPEHRAMLHNVDNIYDGIVRLLSVAGSMTQAMSEDPSNDSNNDVDDDDNESKPQYLLHPPRYCRYYYTSMMAAHVIYIASFADAKNHQGFIHANAVPALATIIKQPTAVPAKVMWAASALQNIAASYCHTPEEDGRCWWDWHPRNTVDDAVIEKTGEENNNNNNNNNTARHLSFTPSQYELRIHPDALPIVSDGSMARQQMLSDEELITRLIGWTCQGPVKYAHEYITDEEVEDEVNEDEIYEHYPWPSAHADAWQSNVYHEHKVSIVPWATTAALKNMALHLSSSAASSTRIIQDMIHDSLPCLCRMTQSPDWLESSKAMGLLENSNVDGSPCWFLPVVDDDDNDTNSEETNHEGDTPLTTSSIRMCIDEIFRNIDGQPCAFYEDVSDDELEKLCDIPNQDGVKPIDACCLCGGGVWEPTIADEEDDGDGDGKDSNMEESLEHEIRSGGEL